MRPRMCLMGLLALLLARFADAAGLDPQTVARRTDELLAKEAYGNADSSAAELLPKSDDTTFLRRAALDLIGAPPTPEEITAFALDLSDNKRAAAVERLLANKKFGENWAHYWRDVIMYRRSEDRALLVGPALTKFLADQFNADVAWDKIARKFITASGDVLEEGSTAIFMAQMGNTEDATAEISRIFMGIQIQCAQCHNHPTDKWKRSQFHELAAFFPRVAVRPLRMGEQRSFEVVGQDRPGGNGKNKQRNGELEHHMPDLDHPDQEGKLMKPVFFVTGQKLNTGLRDKERREKIAEWITAPADRWFAKAFVNRMWAELVGRGFYEPVDDIGPDRKPSAPHTLDYLSENFVASRYDVKWLFRAITATEAYQRQSRSRYEENVAPFTASCPQRLRGDQLYDSLVELLQLPEMPVPPGAEKNPRFAMGSPRGRLNQAFGYDPSVRRDEVAGSIPQALFLMNAPELNRAINGRQPVTSLGKLLASEPKDEAVVQELYLLCLAREPKQTERQTCLDYVRTAGSRSEGFEDILWSLVNSTEFLNRK